MSVSRYTLIVSLAIGLVLGLVFILAIAPETVSTQSDNVYVIDTGSDLGISGERGVDNTVLVESSQSAIESMHSTVVIEWRPRDATGLSRAEYTSMSYIDLRSLAEAGDGRAAAWLARLLAQCRNFPPPQSGAEIDTAIEEMRRTHLVPIYSNGVATMADFNNHLESLEANISVYERRARTCSQVPVDHRAEWESWIHRAFLTGNMDDLAHTLLASTMEDDDYVKLLNDLWESGEPTALFSLSARSLQNFQQGKDPYGQIRQLAYQLAAYTLMQKYYEEFGISRRSNGLESIVLDEIRHWRQQMRPNEVREAEQLASKIIEQNRNCCLVWPEHYFDGQ